MLWICIIALVIAADQVTKFIVVGNIEFGKLNPVINNFFYLTYIENKGAAWGFLHNVESARYFFIILTILVSIALAYYLYKSDNKLLKTSLAFILGGAIGNLIDRISKGSVTDFLDFYFGSYNFPTFNVADMFVVIGTFLLAFYLLFVYKEPSVGDNS